MMSDVVIVHNLGKYYSRYHSRKPITIMEAALGGFRRLQAVETFWALRNISFTVSPGEMLGIIGHNGAGKSTLLQLIGGVGRADEGWVRVNGRIGALLDLGSGFSPDLTGRENIFVCGVVAGLTRQEVARRLESIVSFAELETFLDNPLRTYSTGMQMRLAFSVAVHTEPNILLVDEFLSVGDLAFQFKCLERIKQLRANGCAVILVSHNPEQVQQLCSRALWLRRGQVVAYGKPKEICEQYVNQMRHSTSKRTPAIPPRLTSSGLELRANENRFGSLQMEITDVSLLPHANICSGDSLMIELEYITHQPIEAPIFGITISREDGQICFDTNTKKIGLTLPLIAEQGQIKLHLERLDLANGHYFVDVGVYEQNWEYAYDSHWHVYPLIIGSTQEQSSILNPPLRWETSSPSVIYHKSFSQF